MYSVGLRLVDWKRFRNPVFFASGFGGQYLAVIPQLEMILSILADMDRPHPENKTIIEKALQLEREEKEV